MVLEALKNPLAVSRGATIASWQLPVGVTASHGQLNQWQRQQLLRKIEYVGRGGLAFGPHLALLP